MSGGEMRRTAKSWGRPLKALNFAIAPSCRRNGWWEFSGNLLEPHGEVPLGAGDAQPDAARPDRRDAYVRQRRLHDRQRDIGGWDILV
jgi:hypothetical protein